MKNNQARDLWMFLFCTALAIGGVSGVSCATKTGGRSTGNGGDTGASGGSDAQGGNSGDGGQSGHNGNGGSGGNGSGGASSGGASGSGGSGGVANGGSGGSTTMGGAGGTISANAPKWCSDPNWRIGTTNGEMDSVKIAMSGQGMTDPAPNAGSPMKGAVMASGISGAGQMYVPFNVAAAPEVALAVFFGSYNYANDGTFHWLNTLDYLIANKEIPPLMVVWIPDTPVSWNRTDAGKDMVTMVSTIVSRLKPTYPNLSMKGTWHVLAGQSTTAAAAFDAVWASPDVVGNAILASASLVCFMPNYPYDTLVKSAALKNVRYSMSTGTCDIFGSCAARTAAGCTTCDATNGGQVDASTCHANWLDTDRIVLNALIAKGYDAQLIVVNGGVHANGPTAGKHFADQLRFVFKPITCTQ